MNVLFIQFFSEILQRRPSTVLNVLYNHFVPIVENHQQLTDFTVRLSSLWAEGSRSTLCLDFFFFHCPQFCYLLAFWLLLHGCAVCKLMEVILCKLLPQFLVFSRKRNYLNKWEYFFIFSTKDTCLCFIIYLQSTMHENSPYW